ncbi:hypothetical protein CAPTEDRAFT_204015 [Capitella teleta]|uniref:Uncharacterized protein n=1 Tax=Capitella teleta TaxID=283909 RepID=R7TRK9_CAPTE|nr:hypothetical protein CAPTEDRAFT_204015 [Capitella teleta]|eukprot:ELT93665.1 hypothetical protein CAPTEDRAFT_204015 [Capitella teleta]
MWTILLSMVVFVGVVSCSEENQINKRDVSDVAEGDNTFDREARAAIFRYGKRVPIFRYGKRIFRYGKRADQEVEDSDMDLEKRLFRYGRSGSMPTTYKRLFRYGKRAEDDVEEDDEIEAVKRLFRYGKRGEINTRTAAQQPSVPFRFGERE